MKSSNEATITNPNDHDIVITRMFDAPREIVFEAWTNPEHVANWWDPSGTPLASCAIDLRVDGAFRWEHRGASGHAFSGTYREIVAPQKLVFAVRVFPSGTDPVATLVFTQLGEATQLTITMHCATRQERDAMLQMRIDEGTARTLENLAQYLPTVTARTPAPHQ